MKPKNLKNIRLSEHVNPERYSLTLFPNLEEFTFKGEVEILLTIARSTKEITLHASELEINSAEFIQGPTKLKSQNIMLYEESETATIMFAQDIKSGKGKLRLTFTGILNDKMRGFYRSKYKHEGKNLHMAVTQFESTDARRAFPSFDEPAKKAIFDVNLVIPSDHTAISNTIETEVLEHSPGYKIVKFESTPRMSTYLLAFIVGHFEHIETQTKRGLKVRVFTTHGKKHQAKFALSTARKCMEFYEDYFDIAYPLSTIDLIAIPDFASGAMENWGAVTYRESALLFDEELSSTANKQWVALVIAHELAHMWFGNLVTMEWWTHLWLNEGFASYVEYLAVDSLFPKWNIWSQFVYMDHAKALELDGLKNTHAIEVEVHHPKEISEIFDAVSYSKGASIIRMLASFLGAADFRKGLKIYLKKHRYSNASTEDLWAAFEKVSGKPIGKMMKSWTGKPGYPLITVSEKQNRLSLSQSRYFSSPISWKEMRDETLWSIPIDIKISKNKKQTSYLFSKKSILVPKPKAGEWVKLNLNETSFVRINYGNYLRLLTGPVKKNIISGIDRFGIARDAFAISQSGQISTVEALELALSYKTEDEYIVWAEISSDLRTIDNLIAHEPFYGSYKRFCRGIFEQIGKKVGWHKKKNEPHLQTLLRSVVLYGLGTNGDKKTIFKAKNLFGNIVSKNSKLDSDLRGILYNLVAENGGEKEYLQLMDLYKKSLLHEEQDRILRALCSFKNKNLLRKSLDFAFSKNVRAQDMYKAVSFVFANPIGRDLAWEFLKNNWQMIEKRFSGGHLFQRFVKPAQYFVDAKKAEEIKDFFNRNSASGLERTIAQVVEQIKANSEWLKRDRNNLSIFLQRF